MRGGSARGGCAWECGRAVHVTDVQHLEVSVAYTAGVEFGSFLMVGWGLLTSQTVVIGSARYDCTVHQDVQEVIGGPGPTSVERMFARDGFLPLVCTMTWRCGATVSLRATEGGGEIEGLECVKYLIEMKSTKVISCTPGAQR